jgi:hypothetical protein
MPAELRFDVLAELKNRAGACASLLHGVPPSPLLTAICFGQQEVTPFSFSTALGPHPSGILQINPARLGTEVRSAIDRYAALLEHDPTARQRLERALARDHARDFAVA